MSLSKKHSATNNQPTIEPSSKKQKTVDDTDKYLKKLCEMEIRAQADINKYRSSMDEELRENHNLMDEIEKVTALRDQALMKQTFNSKLNAFKEHVTLSQKAIEKLQQEKNEITKLQNDILSEKFSKNETFEKLKMFDANKIIESVQQNKIESLKLNAQLKEQNQNLEQYNSMMQDNYSILDKERKGILNNLQSLDVIGQGTLKKSLRDKEFEKVYEELQVSYHALERRIDFFRNHLN